jgi:hypothetical protein
MVVFVRFRNRIIQLTNLRHTCMRNDVARAHRLAAELIVE